MKKIIAVGLFILAALLAFLYVGKNYTPEEKEYISAVEKEREEKNDYMEKDPSSPFNQDERAHFSPLKYYDVDPAFVFKSSLFEFENKDTVIIFGTKGEERKVIKHGFVKLLYDGVNYNINIYKGTSRTGAKYHSIWFTDKTTGEETYGVGRYLDFELNPNKDYVYTIDFNKAYNPYCAYSAKFSCAIPSKEDFIDFAVEAGEKNFH